MEEGKAHERADPAAVNFGRGLELMHHYSTASSDTLALRADMQHVWRVTIPEIAYQSPMLMHGILAVAAMHKAYLLPSRRRTYLDLAAFHQNSGLEAFRVTLHDIGEQNWKPFLCFASVIALLVCSIPMESKPELQLGTTAAPDVLQLFVFVPGIRSVLLPYQSMLIGTVLGPLVHGVWITCPQDPSYK